LLARLRESLPDVPTAVASPSDIPLPDDSLDVVVCGSPNDLTAALPEIVRVLKPAGVLGTIFTTPDQRIPWVRRLTAILGLPESPPDPTQLIDASGLFGVVETETFSDWEQLDRESINDFALAHAQVPSATDAARSRLLRDVGELYAEYERGIDGLRLPYVTHCYRATALLPPEPSEDEIAEEPPLIDFS
jgi:SAM-dependent methyltransferase